MFLKIWRTQLRDSARSYMLLIILTNSLLCFHWLSSSFLLMGFPWRKIRLKPFFCRYNNAPRASPEISYLRNFGRNRQCKFLPQIRWSAPPPFDRLGTYFFSSALTAKCILLSYSNNAYIYVSFMNMYNYKNSFQTSFQNFFVHQYLIDWIVVRSQQSWPRDEKKKIMEYHRFQKGNLTNQSIKDGMKVIL